ncbi:UTP--glucose-1-phosphate uridylyltransferase [Chloroflexia bacterium SDU3-3]|nr:UTP--glucose-1-phosphate uridylyltransferase [Chloroflexia bacterium SDU3-3]
MNVTKAVITSAAPNQRTLPLQRLVDRDGAAKTVLQIIVEEAISAEIDEIGVVVAPGDTSSFAEAAGEYRSRLRFIEQAEPLGYGHAVLCARPFVGDQPFLHLVGDHLYMSHTAKGCAQQLVELARAESCAVSAVQPSRESLLPYYGVVGGHLVAGQQNLYLVDQVAEKPTPTEAEQRLNVPGLRVGHYLCFFGMHVLTPQVMDILDRQLAEAGGAPIQLSPALDALAKHERYLALANLGRRYDVGVKYGLLTAQLALALGGSARDEVLAMLVELLATRTIESAQ